jgi:hypothetical protein
MLERLVAFGTTALFRGARRGQPLVAAFGAAVTIWGLFKRMDRRDKPVYTRKLKDGETLRIRSFRGDALVNESDVER